MSSIWTETARLPRFPALEGDVSADVLIVGGGIAGLLCAWKLRQAGADCILVEARQICSGVTGNTTAKVTAQHGLTFHKLVRRFGPERAGLWLRANLAAVEEYRALCREIDCDFRDGDSFVYCLDSRARLKQELAALQKLGFAAVLEDVPPLPFPTAGAVGFPRQGQFHPLKFLGAVARDLPIYENTKVLELMPGGAVTDRGTVRAGRTVVATHFPILNKHGGYSLKLYQSRSYVLALSGIQDEVGMYVDQADGGLSFRNAGDYLLLGGGGHRTGRPGGGWRELEDVCRKYYPQAKIAGRWAAQDCMTLDGLPYVGRYARGTKGLYVATGFNKWGMTSALVAADLLTSLLQGRDDPLAPVLSPSRMALRPQLAKNAAEAAVSLLTPTAPRCPHMGCALKYNRQERSWDCPCHGSRFREDGALLDNPATDDKRGL